jgi:hypothetical protein
METVAEQGPDREPPLLHYRSPPPPQVATAAATANSDGFADRFLDALSSVVMVVCLAIWAVVGAAFWVPLLVRTMVLFSVALIQATLDGKQPARTAVMLRDAVTFYRRGFLAIHSAVKGDAKEQPRAGSDIDGGRLFREMLWAVAIWWAVLALVGLAWGPTEIGTWLSTGPVANGISRFAEWLWSVIYS